MQHIPAIWLALSLAASPAGKPASPERNLVPDFIQICMKPGLDPRSVIANLDSIGAIRIPDSHPESSDLAKIVGFLVNFPDYMVSVMVQETGSCTVALEGNHGSASLASFDRFAQSASGAFDVSHEEPVSKTEGVRVVSSYILANKSKTAKLRLSLVENAKADEEPVTMIGWTIGRY